MPERAWLFLISVVLVLGSLAFPVWLVATGQAASVEGLFLLLAFAVMALVFAVVIKMLLSG